MKLTVFQAYKAMFDFLDQYYKRAGERCEVGEVLGVMAFPNESEGPMDPAIWEDWLESVGKIEKGIPIDIKQRLSFKE